MTDESAWARVPLSVTTDTRRTTAMIKLVGDVDSDSAPDVGRVFNDVLASNPDRIEFDCGDVTYLDSAGIGMLIRCWSSVRDRPAPQVAVTNATPHIVAMLEICGVADTLMT